MNALRQLAQRSIRPIHSYLRGRKVQLFLGLIEGARTESLLDVGGAPGIAGEFLPVYRRFGRIVSANLDAPKAQGADELNLRGVMADGCKLPFPDRSFDWVFSNAVIEHVGNWERQRMFASEIRRVARCGYFVSTPNKYFPLEQHTLLPFYQFLPFSAQRKAVRFSPGYLKHWEEINLLTAGQMRELFPEATVCGSGTPVIPNSLIAFHKCASQ